MATKNAYQELIRAETDVNIAAVDGNIALFGITRSFAKNSLACIELLLNVGADVNIRNNREETVILYAGSSKDEHVIQCVEYLIKVGADVTGKDVNGHTTLMQAARNGFDNYLKLVPKSSMDINAEVNGTGMTALFFAVAEKKTNLVNFLLEAGADVNAVTKIGHTVLQWAVIYGSHECVQELIDAGVDVNKTDKDGTATALILAVGQGKVQCVNTLVNAGADVNKIVGSGITALFTAAGTGSVECISTLLRLGSNINKPSLENNALINHLRNCPPVSSGIVIILYVAGEDVSSTFSVSSSKPSLLPTPLFLLDIKQNMQLKHICREAIRNHLLKLDPHQNLFGRIPKLGLPSALTSYLLYNLSLEVDAIAMKTALKALFNEEVLYHWE